MKKEIITKTTKVKKEENRIIQQKREKTYGDKKRTTDLAAMALK